MVKGGGVAGYIWDMFREYKLAMHVFAFSLRFKSAAKNNNQNKIPNLSDIFRNFQFLINGYRIDND